MTFGISEKLMEAIKARAEAHGLDRLILFGSRARGDWRKTSDIDLAASGGNVPAFAVDVSEDAPTLLDFDIVNLDGAVQGELRESIAREGVVIYEKVR